MKNNLLAYSFSVIIICMVFLTACSQSHMEIVNFSNNTQTKKAVAVFQADQLFNEPEIEAQYKPNVQVKVTAHYKVDDKCQITLLREPEYEIVKNEGTITHLKEVKTLDDRLYHIYNDIHEKDHKKRIEGDFPYIAFIDRTNPEEQRMFELFEGAAVHAQTYGLKNAVMNQGFMEYFKQYLWNFIFMSEPEGYTDVEYFTKKCSENAPLYKPDNGVTYWDAFVKYTKAGETGLKKEYTNFEKRVKAKLKEKLVEKIEDSMPCNNISFDDVMKMGDAVKDYITVNNNWKVVTLTTPKKQENKKTQTQKSKNYCWSCRVQDPGMPRCVQPSCPNYGNPPSMAR